MANVQLAIVYTPEHGGDPVILSRITDRAMLLAAIRSAAIEAECQADFAGDRSTARGLRMKAGVLYGFLAEAGKRGDGN